MKRTRRALLFVPGTEGAKLEKAAKLGVDCVIADWEDAAALSKKPEARATTLAALASVDERVVRVNPIGSGLEPDDFAALASATTPPDAVMLPKVEDVGTPVDNAHWLAILMSCSGYEPFHKKRRDVPMDPAAAVAEFLLYDKEFPRSIRRCVRECAKAARAAAGNPLHREPTAAEDAIGELLAWFDARTSADIIRDGLHEALTHVVDSAIGIGNAIHASFFAAEVKPPPRAAMSQTQS